MESHPVGVSGISSSERVKSTDPIRFRKGRRERGGELLADVDPVAAVDMAGAATGERAAEAEAGVILDVVEEAASLVAGAGAGAVGFFILYEWSPKDVLDVLEMLLIVGVALVADIFADVVGGSFLGVVVVDEEVAVVVVTSTATAATGGGESA